TVELAGVKNPEQVRQYLQATAKLQFWEVATNMELAQNLINANDVLRNYVKSTNTSTTETTADVATTDSNSVAAAEAGEDSASLSSLLNQTEQADSGIASTDLQLFSIVRPVVDQNGQFVDAAIIGEVD